MINKRKLEKTELEKALVFEHISDEKQLTIAYYIDDWVCYCVKPNLLVNNKQKINLLKLDNYTALCQYEQQNKQNCSLFKIPVKSWEIIFEYLEFNIFEYLNNKKNLKKKEYYTLTNMINDIINEIFSDFECFRTNENDKIVNMKTKTGYYVDGKDKYDMKKLLQYVFEKK